MTTSVPELETGRDLQEDRSSPASRQAEACRTGALAMVYREHRALLAVTIAFAASGLLLDRLLGQKTLNEFWQLNIITLPVELSWCILLAAPIYYRLKVRDAEGRKIMGLAGWRAGWRLARAGALHWSRLAGYTLGVVCPLVTLQVFLRWKSAIPALHSFDWDPVFHRLDLALHFGREPFVWLQPLLAFPALTSGLDLAYHHIWLYVLVAFMLAEAIRPPSVERRQALLSFVLMWIVLGTAAAIAFASAGPVYFARVTGAESGGPYQPLFDYLYAVQRHTGPLSALRIQEVLWAGYAGGGQVLGTGISAFPSLHIATTVWFALCAGQWSRRFGAALWGYAALIFLGSVHLGWHYAVDGYAAFVGMAGIWWACGRWARRVGGGGVDDAVNSQTHAVIEHRTTR